MKEYISYLKENPTRMALPIIVLLFTMLLNIVINYKDSSVPVAAGALIFSVIINAVINLQVWGEYKNIEGFWPTVKAFFKW